MRIRRCLHAALLLGLVAPLVADTEGKEPAAAGTTFNVVIAYLGGPRADAPDTGMIDPLVEALTAAPALKDATVNGHYFTTIEEAAAFLTENPDSFVLGSVGFFLSQREELALLPLAKVRLSTGEHEQFYVVVKKGRYRTLEELKGKALTGTPLFETPAFLSKVAFGGALNVETHFALTPTRRALAALRRLTRDRADAVLLTRLQHATLKELPLADELDVIHTSAPIPAVGLMRVDSPTTRRYSADFVQSVTAMCESDAARQAGKAFGVEAFVPVPTNFLSEVKLEPATE